MIFIIEYTYDWNNNTERPGAASPIHHITSSTTQSTETRIKKYQNHRRFGPLLLQHDKNFKPCLIILEGARPSGRAPLKEK